MKQRLLIKRIVVFLLALSIFVFSLGCYYICAKRIVGLAPLQNEQECQLKQAGRNTVDNLIDYLEYLWNCSIYGQDLLSHIDSVVTFCASGEINSNQVICGEKRWLFYKSKNDGDPIEDYEGTNRYSEKELQQVLKSTQEFQTNIEQKNIKPIIVVAPNKENVYTEYMPDIYKHNPISSTDILIDFLRSNGIRIISLKSDLLENCKDFQLYYRYDTHWNQLGAYVGLKNILKEWNITLPELREQAIQFTELRNQFHDAGSDDLARMIGMLFLFNDEKEYRVRETPEMDWAIYDEEQNQGKLSHFYNEEADQDSTVLLLGDSFRTAMVPALRSTFRDVYVLRKGFYETGMLEEICPDYLIVEYVERYSRELEYISSIR